MPKRAYSNGPLGRSRIVRRRSLRAGLEDARFPREGSSPRAREIARSRRQARQARRDTELRVELHRSEVVVELEADQPVQARPEGHPAEQDRRWQLLSAYAARPGIELGAQVRGRLPPRPAVLGQSLDRLEDRRHCALGGGDHPVGRELGRPERGLDCEPVPVRFPRLPTRGRRGRSLRDALRSKLTPAPRQCMEGPSPRRAFRASGRLPAPRHPWSHHVRRSTRTACSSYRQRTGTFALRRDQ